MQFFRDRLCQRCADVLPDLDLARVNGHRAFFVHMEPSGDILRHLLAAKSAAASAGFSLLREGGFAYEENSDARAKNLHEVAPLQIKAIDRFGAQLVAFRLDDDFGLNTAQNFRRGGEAHRLSPFVAVPVGLAPAISAAARCTAATMRG